MFLDGTWSYDTFEYRTQNDCVADSNEYREVLAGSKEVEAYTIYGCAEKKLITQKYTWIPANE